MPSIPFLGGAYESASLPVSAQEAVNCFLEAHPQATNQAIIKGVPGTRVFVDLTNSVRGMFRAYGYVYAVAGDVAYRISSMGTADTLGNVGNDGLPVSITANVNEVLFVSAGKGYVAQKGAKTLAEITDVDFPVTSKADFIDGYGLLLEKNSGRFYFTAISDFESISDTDFVTAEGAPDNLVSLLVDHREIFLFGEQTIEIWYNDGTSPFIRSPGGLIERGCRGTFSPAKVDNTVFWLGDDGIIYRIDDNRPIRVSNHGIENLIRKWNWDLAIGFGYSQDGHAFYQLNFPGEGSVVYDAATGFWHTRKTGERSDCVYHFEASSFGKVLVGGVDGKIYELDPALFTHSGADLVRTRAAGPLRTDTYFSTLDRLEVMMETGGGDYAADSNLMLRISDDAGKSFTGPIETPVGKLGAYTTEVVYTALGGFYDNERVLSVSMSDDAPFVLVDMKY